MSRLVLCAALIGLRVDLASVGDRGYHSEDMPAINLLAPSAYSIGRAPDTRGARPVTRLVQAIICVLALVAIGCGPAESTPALPRISPPTIASQSAVTATATVQPDPNTAQIIYLRGDYGAPGEIVAAGADGGEPRVLATLPSFNSATNNLDVDSTSGAFVYTADLARSVWSGALADRPHKITDGAGGWHDPSPRISPDGRTVAYAVHHERSAPSEPQPPPSEVWLVGIDGRGGRKLAEDSQGLISFPFGLSPIGWSGDGSKIYLLATAESEYVPTGPYQVDVATGAIERAPMPDEPPWSLALSPDGNYLAYSTWAIDPDSLVLPVPPYRLRVTDLRTGNTITVLESGKQLYGPIVWSPEGERLLVGVEGAWSEEDGDKPEEPSRFIGVDIGTGQTWEPAAWIENLPVDLTPQLWLPGERVVLVDGAGALGMLDLDDEWWVELDEAPEVVVMGYVVPEGDESSDVDRMVESSDSHGQLSMSPNGQWRARLLVSDPDDGGAWHRSQLRVESVDGTAGWTAIDEYIPHAICGDDMMTIGWGAIGDYTKIASDHPPPASSPGRNTRTTPAARKACCSSKVTSGSPRASASAT